MRFRITYTDPETGEEKIEEGDFIASQSPPISAREWAEDYAYSLADKGAYKVEEVEL